MAADRKLRKLSSLKALPRLARGHLQLLVLVNELATVLLPRGVTPKSFAELGRIAFVRAAADRARLINGRVNYSRVAAQTGLTRADVRRLLHRNNDSRITTNRTPVEKVIGGWRLDRDFTTKQGRPRPLSMDGPTPSFQSLAKKYGGDIPHRAILEELKDARAITIRQGSIKLNRGRYLPRRGTPPIPEPVMLSLLDGLKIASVDAKRRPPTPSIQRIELPVDTEIDLAIVRERCATIAGTMLEGLAHTLGRRVTRPNRKKNSGYTFTVTVMLAEHRLRRVPTKNARG